MSYEPLYNEQDNTKEFVKNYKQLTFADKKNNIPTVHVPIFDNLSILWGIGDGEYGNEEWGTWYVI